MTNPFDAAVLDVVNEKLAELDADPVDGDQLLHDISSFIARYLHCSEHQRAILALWVLHTYTYQAAQCTPYLSIQSAEKQAGKTRCLLLLHLLCDYPALTAGFTASSLFRLMKSNVDTLLLDECQAGVGTRSRSKAPTLRAILAGGSHSQSNRFAAHDRNRFCPKAFAGRGPLPEDLADLSIPIILEPLKTDNALLPKTPGITTNSKASENAEGGFRSPDHPITSDLPIVNHGPDSRSQQKIERLHIPDATQEVKPLHKQLRIWKNQNLACLKEGPAYLPEDFPPNLSPRRQDMVEPLLQIADLSGGEWPKRIREALVAVFEEQTRFDLQANIQLLADIRDCFAHHGNPDRLSTADLVAWMPTLPPRPWDIDGRFSAHTLAHLLSPFGIRPRNQRMNKATTNANHKPKRGYQLEDFQESWQKHLGFALQNSEIARNDAVCNGVTHAGEISHSTQENLDTKPEISEQLLPANHQTTNLPGYQLPESSLSPAEGPGVPWVTCDLSPVKVTHAGEISLSTRENLDAKPGMSEQLLPSNYQITNLPSYQLPGSSLSPAEGPGVPWVTCDLSPVVESTLQHSRTKNVKGTVKKNRAPKRKKARNVAQPVDPAQTLAELVQRLNYLQDSLRLDGRVDVTNLYSPEDLKARLDWVDAHQEWWVSMVEKHCKHFMSEFQVINVHDQ